MSRFGARTARLCALMLLVALIAGARRRVRPRTSPSRRSSIGAAVDRQRRPARQRASRTVDFDGQFSWVEWKLNTKGSDGIEILGVSTVRGDTEQHYDQGRR